MAAIPPPPAVDPCLIRKLSTSSDELVLSRTSSARQEGDGADILGEGEGKNAAALQEQQPWSQLDDAMAAENITPAVGKAAVTTPPLADPAALRRSALGAQLEIQRTRELVFGPNSLLWSASCFNWALGAGELGFRGHSWLVGSGACV